MNIKKTFLATTCLYADLTMYAQQIDVQPVPQKVLPATQAIQLTGIYMRNFTITVEK